MGLPRRLRKQKARRIGDAPAQEEEDSPAPAGVGLTLEDVKAGARKAYQNEELVRLVRDTPFASDLHELRPEEPWPEAGTLPVVAGRMKWRWVCLQCGKTASDMPC